MGREEGVARAVKEGEAVEVGLWVRSGEEVGEGVEGEEGVAPCVLFALPEEAGSRVRRDDGVVEGEGEVEGEGVLVGLARCVADTVALGVGGAVGIGEREEEMEGVSELDTLALGEFT